MVGAYIQRTSRKLIAGYSGISPLRAMAIGAIGAMALWSQPLIAQPLQTGAFSFQITTSDPVLGDGECDTPSPLDAECSHVLDSVTVGADTFTAFTSPSSFSAVGFPATSNIQSRIFNAQGAFQVGDPTYGADMTSQVFSDTDLNRYQQVDTNANLGVFRFTYPRPIPATGDFFFLLTERNGNNTQVIEAFDQNGLSLGTVSVVRNSGDYSDAGVRVIPTQNAFISLTPLSTFADATDATRQVQSFEITNGANDGGDHKAFVIGNVSLSGPQAVNDEDLDNVPGPVTVDILANDTPTGTLVGSTVELAGSTGPGQPVVVPGQGTWSINTANGEVTFTPEATFGDDPTPIGYTVQDGAGQTTNQATITITYLIDPEITLVKTITGVADTNTANPLGGAGDTITYSLTATNTGNVSLANVAITDALLGLTDALVTPDDLAPGASGTLTDTYVIQPADVTAGEVENTATASGTPVATTGGAADPANPLVDITGAPLADVTDTSDTGTESDINGGTPVTIPSPETVDSNGTGALDDDPTVLILPGAAVADITLVKTITDVADTSPTTGILGDAGDTVTYTFTVTNSGTTSLATISIEDANLSPTTTAVPTNLLPGASASVTRTYVITPADVTAGEIVNTATVTGTPVNNDAGGAPDPTNPLGIGDVTDTSDTGTEPAINGGTPVTIASPETVDSDGIGALDDDPTQLILPGAPAPAITLVKEISSVTNTSTPVGVLGDAGDTINYTLTVTNTGNTSLADITVTDGLLGLAGAAVTPSALLPGGTATITGSYVILPADVTAGQVLNTASTTGTPVNNDAGGAPDPTNPLGLGDVTDTSDTGTESAINGGTPVTIASPETVDSDGVGALDDDPTLLILPTGPVPAITLVKSITDVADTDTSTPLGGAGDTVTYTLTVTNTGNTSLAGVTITDALLGLTDAPVTPADLAPGDSATLTDTYIITPADVAARRIINTATAEGTPVATTPGGAPDPGTPLGLGDVTDTSDTGTENGINGGTPVTVPDPGSTDSDGAPGNDGDEPTVLILTISAAPIPPGEIGLIKTTPNAIIQRGQLVPYTIRLQNNTGTDFAAVDIIDTLPSGFVYVPGTTELDGVPVVPTVTGNVVTVSGVASVAGSERVVTLTLRALTGTNPGTYVNTALALDPILGLNLGSATATVRILPEAVFDCGEVIGRVFHDLDGDGYQDSFEPGVNPAELTNQDYDGDKFELPVADLRERGLPGVRLVTLDGLIITTDENGLFSVPCAALPADRGSNFLLSLDERTLPLGFAMTTENPRVMRLTPGMVIEMNFGARLEDQVRVDLNAHAFGHGAALSTELRQGLVALVDYLAENPSGVALSYQVGANAGPEEVAEGRARMALVEATLEEIWRERGGGGLLGLGRLDIEQSIQRAGN